MKHERIKIKFDNLDTQSKSKLMLGHVNFIDLDSELADLNYNVQRATMEL